MRPTQSRGRGGGPPAAAAAPPGLFRGDGVINNRLNQMSVDLYDRDKLPVTTPLILTPIRYNADAYGGPATAMIDVNGQGVDTVRKWLGYYVIIRNTNGTPVWWGRIEEASVAHQNIDVGVSLKDVKNRVRIEYSYLTGDGEPVSAVTDWAEHERSIDVYGTFEESKILGEASTEQAEGVRDRILDVYGLPKQEMGLGRSVGQSASLRCVGLWQTLRQTYYSNSAGLEIYDGIDNTEQVMGWGLSGSDIGFADKMIQSFSGGLDALQPGDKVSIVGSSSNDGALTMFNVSPNEVQTYAATTISFDPGDDIQDSAEGLGFVQLGYFLHVVGSASNSGYHLIDELGRNHLATVDALTGPIVFEAAGPSITLTQAQTIEVEESITNEIPGSSITMTAHGQKIAYSFVVSAAINWDAHEVWVKIRRYGTPGDNVKVELCSNSGGSPGSVLASATVTGLSVKERADWVQFTLSSAASLTAGATYWIVVSRTGANSHTDYYAVGLDDLAGGTGTIKLWTGAAWVSRSPDASMPFQVWGNTETSEQIEKILTDEGQYFSGVGVRVDSGLYRRQYRDGSLKASDELDALIEAGTSSGDRLSPTITPQWRVMVDTLPSQFPLYLLRQNRTLAHISGVEVEEGVLPVGQWCNIDGIDSQVDALAPLAPFVIGFMEYQVERKEIVDIRALDTGNLWSLI